MDLRINGKRALVTGSTSGIGEAIALALAAEGVHVVVHGRREAEALRVVDRIRSSGGSASFAIGDLATDAGAKFVADRAGPVDILINNAGAFPETPWFKADAQAWTTLFEQNVNSMVRLNTLLVPGMIERKWGRVIAIASDTAVQPRPTMPAYSVTKAANVSLAVSLAQAVAGTGVTSNTISPGPILTDGIRAMAKQYAIDNHWEGEELQIISRFYAEFAPTPVGRPGKPQEIAALACFLVSEHAGYVTGANYRMDGGVVPTIN
jgi:3-oxoacyl-[acyl-carrier protein] reductase